MHVIASFGVGTALKHDERSILLGVHARKRAFVAVEFRDCRGSQIRQPRSVRYGNQKDMLGDEAAFGQSEIHLVRDGNNEVRLTLGRCEAKPAVRARVLRVDLARGCR